MSEYNHVEELFFEADELINQKKIIEARDVLIQILEIYPDYAKAHNHLGWIFHYKITNYTKAELHYKLALKYENTSYHAPYGNYAYFLIDKGDFDDMIDFGHNALKKSYVDKGTIYNQIGKAYELKANLDKAYHFYKKAKLNSTSSSYIEEINASLHRLKDKMSLFKKLKYIFQ